jgi:Domain of unknown function (DUF6745)
MAAETLADRVERRLQAIDPGDPRVDHAAAEDALGRYLEALGLQRRPVRWLPDIRTLKRERVWPTSRRGRWHALSARQASLFRERWRVFDGWGWNSAAAADDPEDAGWLAALDAIVFRAGLGISRNVRGVYRLTPLLTAAVIGLRLPRAAPPRWVEALGPLGDAAVAGLFCYSVASEGELACVERPTLQVDERGRLHAWDGTPAVHWPKGHSLWYWRGVGIAPSVGRNPEALTARQVLRWSNVERRRVAIERIGAEAFLDALDAEVVQQDDHGRLWRTTVEVDGEPFTAVEVVNSTPEPDGTYRRYFLRVPPTVRSARRAVAWTFGLRAGHYDPVAMT